MMCNHCKANVEKALANVKGVTAVRVELTEGRAFVDGDNFSQQEIVDTIRSLGYEYVEE